MISLKMNRRNVLIGAGALSAMPWIRTANAQSASDEIAIGATVPMTGSFAMTGQQYHAALQIAQEDINAQGGLGGRPLRFVFEDVGDSNSGAVNAFVKIMQDTTPPFVFLSSYTTQNLAVEPEVRKAGVPVFYAGGNDAIAARGNPWMFRIRPNDAVQSIAMAKFSLETLKAKKPALLFLQNDLGQGASEQVRAHFKDAGIEIVAAESYRPTDSDVSAQLLAIRNAGADVILAICFPRDGALIVKQRAQLGIDIPLVAAAGLSTPAAINLLLPEETKDVYSITDAVLAPETNPVLADYVNKFRAKLKIEPDVFGTTYYDAAMILKQVVDEVGFEREKIRNALTDFGPYKGITHDYETDEVGNMVHFVSLVRFAPGTTDLEFIERIGSS